MAENVKKKSLTAARAVQKMGRVRDVKGVVGVMHGDVKNYDNGGKDRAILELEKISNDTLKVLLQELQSYHANMERKEDYIREVVRKSFERNEEKDRMIMKLIDAVMAQDARIQERADRLFALVERVSPALQIG